MRVASLPSPGLLSNGIRIRIEMAKAISAIEINGGISINGGKSSAAAPFKAFLDASNAAIATFLDVTAPTVASRSVALSNTKRIVLAFSEGLDEKFVPAPAAFAITGQTRVISNVTVDGPFVYLDLATAVVAGALNVAYTQPGAASNLRDLSGNLVASFTAAAVTNPVV